MLNSSRSGRLSVPSLIGQPRNRVGVTSRSTGPQVHLHTLLEQLFALKGLISVLYLTEYTSAFIQRPLAWTEPEQLVLVHRRAIPSWHLMMDGSTLAHAFQFERRKMLEDR